MMQFNNGTHTHPGEFYKKQEVRGQVGTTEEEQEEEEGFKP